MKKILFITIITLVVFNLQYSIASEHKKPKPEQTMIETDGKIPTKTLEKKK